MSHGTLLHWTEALSTEQDTADKPLLAKPVKVQTHQSQHAYFSLDTLVQQSQNVCSSSSLSPHALFMNRPLAPSESLVKSSEGFLSSSSHNSFSSFTEHIIWTLIERNFLLAFFFSPVLFLISLNLSSSFCNSTFVLKSFSFFLIKV